MLPVFIYYFSSLKLYAYNSLFFIDYSFFVTDSIEMKIWDAILIFLYLLTHASFKTALLTALIVVFTVLPFVLNVLAFRDSEIHRSKMKFIVYITVYLAYSAFLVVMMQFLQISSIFVYEIKIKFMMENPEYCKIINGNNESELIILENPTVPYKLFFAESTVKYFKPNEPIADWQTLSPSNIINNQSLCASLNLDHK